MIHYIKPNLCALSVMIQQVSYFIVKLRQAGKSGTARVKRVANGVRKTLAVAAGSWRLRHHEPAHAILNIAVWQGDAAPPFEPPAPSADRRTVMVTARVNARRSMPPTRLRRQSVARTRTWTVSGTGIGRERSRQAARDRQRSEPVRRWANTHAAAERGPQGGIEGAESLASPCRGPAKRGPKG